jgi:putative ABC transport system ATP-binding protein/macrolide transport system ATP-binding/permease protein/lipoprotein-releasing system ATP-binding protein
MSGGEQRRVVIARALINSPRLLLADEPTSDLDEDTEADIIDLLEHLQQRDSFALVLVTHNLELAKRAQRTYEMRQGVLEATDLPQVAVEAKSRPRHFGPAKILAEFEPETAAATRSPIRLGANLWRGVQTLVLGGAVVFLGVMLIDFGVAKYQQTQVRARGAKIAKLAEMALSSLEGEVQSVSDIGDGRYELSVSLWNATGEQSIYVMSPDMHGYVQVGKIWQELPLKPTDDGASVTKIEGKHIYRYMFEARVSGFTQLLPNYMHVRFSDTMLVSPSSTPKDDVFERRDNYYVYLKPFDVADDVVLKRLKFPGKPPVWIPMPPH